MSIETNTNLTSVNYIHMVGNMRNQCVQRLWQKVERHNTYLNLTREDWQTDLSGVIKIYQDNLTDFIKRGYDGREPEQIWTFPASLMFCLSVFSMIGYGNMVPKTDVGKVMTVFYATFGIPLYILYFMNIGKVLAKTFRWLYTWIHECSTDPELEDDSIQTTRKRIVVPSTSCLWVMFFYIVIGTLMFSELEEWNYLNAVYFCVTSLCKIGIGDFVPGTNATGTLFGLNLDERDGNHTKLIINFVYILFGMALVAMCYNLMREDIRVKIKETKEDLALCLEDLRKRFARCCGNNIDSEYEY